jgi:predicted nucleic acid-binding Zn ribbon protein
VSKNNQGGRKPEKNAEEQRRLRLQQIVFIAFAVLLILSMVLSLVRF